MEHSAWRQMKENYQIYLPYQFYWRPQSALWDAKLPHKKIKSMFLSDMSKSRRLTSTFFPITVVWEHQRTRRGYRGCPLSLYINFVKHESRRRREFKRDVFHGMYQSSGCSFFSNLTNLHHLSLLPSSSSIGL